VIKYTVIPRLKIILKERGMTQVQLEKLTGVPQATISSFDKSKQHTDWHLIAISKGLDIPIEDLFDVEEQLTIDINL
jgi:transcriptional regulator with XRE-family HTH domain